jgi:hypothetical protein
LIMPRIHAVALGEQPMTLRVRWDEGGEGPVDVSGMPSEIFTVSEEEQTGETMTPDAIGIGASAWPIR